MSAAMATSLLYQTVSGWGSPVTAHEKRRESSWTAVTSDVFRAFALGATV